MIQKTINIPFKTVDYINHISDVHIRLYKRHTEYEYVFERLKQILTNTKPNTINCIVGDIAHAKTEMSPELLDMVNKFLLMVAENNPTFIILGNHDCNLNNPQRLDVLEPIIKIMKHPNLHYLKHTGIYTVADTDLFVYSLLDKPEVYPPSHLGKSNKKICMYHGIIGTTILDNGMEVIRDTIPYSMFDGFDIVLAGDIHRQQDLQNYELLEREIDEDELEKYTKEGWVVAGE